MFYGNFGDKSDVCKEFSIPDFDGAVVFAAYDTADYEGSAEVIYVHNGTFYMVSGGHCSCYGLEGQWEPIEMSLEGLRRIIEQGNGMLSNYRDGLSEAIEVIETLNIEGASSDVAAMALKLAFG